MTRSGESKSIREGIRSLAAGFPGSRKAAIGRLNETKEDCNAKWRIKPCGL